MSRTITAMFDTQADAEAGRQRLIAANIDADNVRVHGQDTAGYSNDEYSEASHGKTGIWGSVKNAMMPDEDRHTYEEGVRRGGYVLTADVDDDEIDEAVKALEETSSIDIDDRSKGWRESGWTAPVAGAGAMSTPTTDMSSNTSANTMRGTTNDGEQTLPVIEEKLVVGKREVERGGVRVRSYVTEKPVHEQVRLREEHVNVTRRPVDRAVGTTDDAFAERTIELTERSEEAVVGKEARVVEEVVVSKTADERTQDINETVRRTDVDVENIGGSTTDRGFTSNDGTKRDGETLGEKARDLVQDAKEGLGLGNDNKGSGKY